MCNASCITRVKISFHSSSDAIQDCYLPLCSKGNRNIYVCRKPASDTTSRRWAGRRESCDLCSLLSTLLLPVGGGREPTLRPYIIATPLKSPASEHGTLHTSHIVYRLASLSTLPSTAGKRWEETAGCGYISDLLSQEPGLVHSQMCWR